MSYYNQWLHEQIQRLDGVKLSENYDPLVVVSKDSQRFRIYCPRPEEYIITIDVVQKVLELRGNTISYANSWCRPSHEAEIFAKENGVKILPHGATLAILSK